MRRLLRNTLLALVLAQPVSSQGDPIWEELFVDGKQGGNGTNATASPISAVNTTTPPAVAANDTTTAPLSNITSNPDSGATTTSPAGNATTPPDTTVPPTTTVPPVDVVNTTMPPYDGNETIPPSINNGTTEPPLPPLDGNVTTRPPVAPGGTNGTTPAPIQNGTIPTIPPVTPPVQAPTQSPGAPVPEGAKRQNINVQFIVSNLENIESPATVNSSGLSAAWPPFVEDVVADIQANGRRRRRRLNPQQRHRNLRVDYETGSAYIYDITLIDCPENSHKDLTCHNAFGTYSLLLYDEPNAKAVETQYGTGTAEAIEQGQLAETLKEVDPDSPLYIGPLAPPDSKSGVPVWLIILIVLLAVLCCCCILAAVFLNKDRLLGGGGGGQDKAEPYDEEGFAYDFLIPSDQKVQTEVDDEHDEEGTREANDVEDFFEDEDVNAKFVIDDDDEEEVPVAPATVVQEDDESEREVNVTAEVEDEDDIEWDESEPLVAGDGAETDDNAAEALNDSDDAEDWDDEDAAETDDNAAEAHNEIDNDSDDSPDAEDWDDAEDKDDSELPDAEDWDDEDGKDDGADAGWDEDSDEETAEKKK